MSTGIGLDEAALVRALGEVVSHLERRRPKEAARLCRPLLKARPDDAEVLNLAGIASFQTGNAKRALELAEAVARRGRAQRSRAGGAPRAGDPR